MGGARGGVDPVGPASDGQRRGRAQDRRGSLAGGQVGEPAEWRRAHGRLLCAVRCQRGDGGREARRLHCRRRDHLERLPASLGDKEQLRADVCEVGP